MARRYGWNHTPGEKPARRLEHATARQAAPAVRVSAGPAVQASAAQAVSVQPAWPRRRRGEPAELPASQLAAERPVGAAPQLAAEPPLRGPSRPLARHLGPQPRPMTVPAPSLQRRQQQPQWRLQRLPLPRAPARRPVLPPTGADARPLPPPDDGARRKARWRGRPAHGRTAFASERVWQPKVLASRSAEIPARDAALALQLAQPAAAQRLPRRLPDPEASTCASSQRRPTSSDHG